MSDQQNDNVLTPVPPVPAPELAPSIEATAAPVATTTAPEPAPDATPQTTEPTPAQPDPTSEITSEQPAQAAEPTTPPIATATPNPAPAAPTKRIFKIGAARIAEDDTTAKLSNELVQEVLKAAYPEVAHATIRETDNGDTKIVEFLPRPGTKG